MCIVIHHTLHLVPKHTIFIIHTTKQLSVNDNVCRVDFDEAWIRKCDDSFNVQPYENIDSVPDSISKTLIRNMGKALFIEAFAVFPVSYLDNDLIVFDFELLGTRICAYKMTKT